MSMLDTDTCPAGVCSILSKFFTCLFGRFLGIDTSVPYLNASKRGYRHS